MIQLQQHAAGVVLPVRAQPGARKSGIRGQHGGSLKVSVTQVAERGKANLALIDVLCQALDLRKGQVELIAGASSTEKRFLVRNIELPELARRIAVRLDASRSV